MRKFTLFFLFILLNLEVFFSNSSFIYLDIFVLIMFITDIILKNKLSIKLKIPKYYFLFIALIFIGSLRSNLPNFSLFTNVPKLLIFLLLIISFYLAIINSRIKNIELIDVFIWGMFIPLLALVIINLIGYYIDVKSSSSNDINLGTSVTLSFFGISKDRVSFPFTPGFNSYGVLSGILMIFSSIGALIFDKKYKYLMYIGVISSFLTLVYVDTRSVLGFVFFLTLISFFLLKKDNPPKYFWITPFISIVGPFVIILPVVFLQGIIDFSSFQRSNEDFSSFNGRNFIWLKASLEFISFKPMHIFGYGDFGHYITGASKLWAHIFGSWDEERALLTTPHSTFYSILYDYGYFGLFVYILFQLKLVNEINKIWFYNKKMGVIFINFLLYWNLVGITETIHGFYMPIVFYFFTLISLLIIKSKMFQNEKFD